jgi:phosphoglycerate dehydrogenase-like enzyme
MAASAPGSAPRQVKRLTADTSVGVLGLGEIGREIAFAMRREGFDVRGWSCSPKQPSSTEFLPMWPAARRTIA